MYVVRLYVLGYLVRRNRSNRFWKLTRTTYGDNRIRLIEGTDVD